MLCVRLPLPASLLPPPPPPEPWKSSGADALRACSCCSRCCCAAEPKGVPLPSCRLQVSAPSWSGGQPWLLSCVVCRVLPPLLAE